MAGKAGDRRQVMVPDPIWKKVKEAAQLKYTSASQIVREALVQHLEIKAPRK